MSDLRFHTDFHESTRGRIIGVLRRGRASVDQLASELGVTPNAVRAQLATLQRDGLVRSAGVQPGATRPFRTYELTDELDKLLSRAYIPLLTQLMRLFEANEPASKFDWAMREAGRGLAREVSVAFPSGPLESRVAAACQVLNRELGASTAYEKLNSGYVIRGSGCPLAALTGRHPGVCHAIESFVAELLQMRVRECCEREGRPRCCFQIASTVAGTRKPVRRARR